MNLLNYSTLSTFATFEDRFNYLCLKGFVADPTFNEHRFLNQDFYRSREWKDIRNKVIVRDNGCDLGIQDRPINGKIYVHHMNPITIDDILHCSDRLINLDYLICVSHNTHNAIHYGDINLLIPSNIVERQPGDTKLW